MLAFSTFTLLGMGAYWQGYLKANRDNESNYASYQKTQNNYSKCLGLSTIEEARACFRNAPKVSPTEHRAQDDLNAQREMAKYASLMFWATIFAAIIGGIGVFFVYQTLSAAREMNKIVLLEQRPWVTIKRELDGILTLLPFDEPAFAGTSNYEGWANLVWQFKQINVGKSPAFGIYTKQKLVCVSNDYEVKAGLEDFVNDPRIRGKTKHKDTVFPGEAPNSITSNIQEYISQMPAKSNFLVLYHGVFYRSLQSEIEGIEARAIFVEYNSRTLGPWPVKLMEMSRYRITQ